MLPAGLATEQAIAELGRPVAARRYAHRWRQQLLEGRHPACARLAAEGPLLPRRWHVGRRLGARARLLPDDRRRQGGRGAARSDLRGARTGQGRYRRDATGAAGAIARRAGLSARRAERGGPLRQDDPQRHRVRHDAGHRRGLRHPEERRLAASLPEELRLAIDVAESPRSGGAAASSPPGCSTSRRRRWRRSRACRLFRPRRRFRRGRWTVQAAIEEAVPAEVLELGALCRASARARTTPSPRRCSPPCARASAATSSPQGGNGDSEHGRRAPMVIVLMGVSGSGKSTTGLGLAQLLGWPFRDADSFHPPANIAKMSRGIPLEDSDRWPWLDAIAAWIDAQLEQGQSGLVSCSALKPATAVSSFAIAPTCGWCICRGALSSSASGCSAVATTSCPSRC